MTTVDLQPFFNDFKQHTKFFRDAETIYKDVQQKVGGIDTSVLNEFRYAGRHQTSMFESICNSDTTSLMKALENANRAVACAINDSIDGVIIFAKEAIRRLHESYDKCDIGMYYGMKDYENFWVSIKNLENVVSQSRGDIHTRIATYMAIFNSDDFKRVVDFCAEIPKIEDKLIREYRHRYAIEAAKTVTITQWLIDRSIQLIAATAAVGALIFSIYSYKNPPQALTVQPVIQESHK
jgi:hypothetical protein